MNRDELQTWHSTVGLTGGLTMTSEPWHLPEFQSDEARRMWEIVRPPAAERAVAWGATPTDPQQPRLGFIAERAWGRFACVQLFNHQDCPGDVALRTAELDPLGKKFHAWSFWDRKYLGVISPAFVARKLPAHGSMLLRLTPVESDGKPTLVGSDLHVAMGSTEVADWTFDGERLIVTLTPGAGARQGSLWIHSDKKLSFANDPGSASCDATLQRPKRGCPGVWRLDIGRGTSSVDRVTMQVTPSGKRRAIPLPKLPSLNVAMTCSEEPTWLLGSASRTKARAMLRMESSDGAAWKGLIRISIEPASAATGFPRQIDAHVASERAFERAIDLDIEQGVRRVTVVASLAPPVAKSLGLSAVEPAGSSRLSSITLRPRPFVTIPRDRSTTVTLSPQGMAATNVQLRASERGLHVEARVCDLKVTPGEPIWAGSCLELFAAKETEPTAIAQFFLSPGDDRKPARAMLAKGLEQVPAEDVRVEASPLTRGYTLAAMIPWTRLALAGAESGPAVNWLLELQLTTHGPGGQTRATAGGSTEAYAKSDLYVRVSPG
jgi:hypothetical protein